MRTHVCPCSGLILDRDENGAVTILARGGGERAGRWPQEAGEPTALRGTVGHTETERLGTAGLLRWGASPALAPAGGSRNLWHSCRRVSIQSATGLCWLSELPSRAP